MRLFSLLFILILTACQDYNSNSGDRGTNGSTVLDETDPNFEKAYSIIQNRCVSCHDHTHDKWADFKSNADWSAEKLVTPGKPGESELIERIINTGGADSTMPIGGSALPADEYAHLIKWVTEFK